MRPHNQKVAGRNRALEKPRQRGFSVFHTAIRLCAGPETFAAEGCALALILNAQQRIAFSLDVPEFSILGRDLFT